MKRLISQLFSGGGAAPSSAIGAGLPEGQRVYAIGDVHGRSDLLRRMIDLIKQDVAGYTGTVTLVMIGDYIDRGPDSGGVVSLLQNEVSQAWNTVFLRGNHEQAMLDFGEDPEGRPEWLAWGGVQALESYDVTPYGARGLRDPKALAAELEHALAEQGHRAFYEATRLHHVIGPYLFVHAGVRPRVPLTKQMPEDLLFIREDFVGRPHGLPYVVVFGHTIMRAPLNEPDRIGIDTGAYQSNVLTAVVLEGDGRRFLQT
jgi:serine/threonine protein phosphatase 1